MRVSAGPYTLDIPPNGVAILYEADGAGVDRQLPGGAAYLEALIQFAGEVIRLQAMLDSCCTPITAIVPSDNPANLSKESRRILNSDDGAVKGLTLIASFKGRSLMSEPGGTYELGAYHAFDQCADIARDALGLTP